MKITAIARILNEENNLERFIRAHSFCDYYVFADGGSGDKTLEILENYKKILGNKINILHYPKRIVYKENGQEYYLNPENEEFNWLVCKAKEITNPDWLIMDDCDSVPNYLLQQDARKIFTETDNTQVRPMRLYLYKNLGYFPELCSSGQTSVWAWKSSDNILGDETKLTIEYTNYRIDALKLDYPYCLLHDSWPTEEEIQRKMKRYSAIRHAFSHPESWAGNVEPLPEWAKDY